MKSEKEKYERNIEWDGNYEKNTKKNEKEIEEKRKITETEEFIRKIFETYIFVFIWFLSFS